MCGIFGVCGLEQAPRHVRDALERLEYRGYDSAGIAWHDPSVGIAVVKQTGRVAGLPQLAGEASVLAIGHTRWATHGGVTQANAHPHVDGTGRFAIVHNGTLEAHRRLRAGLEADGHAFISETDSEAIAHLYERHRRTLDPLSALRATLSGLHGSWALLVMDPEARAIAFARNRTPLLAGLAAGATLFASDLAALVPHTRRVVALEDGDHGLATPAGIQLYDAQGRAKPLQPFTVDWDVSEAQRGGYQYFMLKEMHETPAAINQCLGDRIRRNPLAVDLDQDLSLWQGVRAVRLVACGTSFHAARLGAWMLESWAGIPSQAVVASELRDRPLVVEDGVLHVGVSQSGETLDTIEALRPVVSRGHGLLAVCNVQGSALSRMADGTLLTRVGPEVGVAATKTFAGQVATLALLALERGLALRRITPTKAHLVAEGLQRMPRTLDAVIRLEPELAALGRRLAESQDLFFLGHGAHVATANEAALKFKEITYRHAEGFGSAELKHGPFALLDEATPCVFFLSDDEARPRVLGNIQEVAARGAPVHVLAQGDTGELAGVAASIVRLPPTDPLLAALPFALAGQFLAYHAASSLGRDIDKPRNLAKSVTVE